MKKGKYQVKDLHGNIWAETDTRGEADRLSAEYEEEYDEPFRVKSGGLMTLCLGWIRGE